MNPNKLLFIVLPLFALACGSSPATTTADDEVNSARQALEEGEEPEAPEAVETVEEPAPLALAGDAGAPEAPVASEEPPPPADAGAPLSCTEGQSSCVGNSVEACIEGVVTTTVCDDQCTDGACSVGCHTRGTVFCGPGGIGFCDAEGVMRWWERPDLIEGQPLNCGGRPAGGYQTLPLAVDPPAWLVQVDTHGI